MPRRRPGVVVVFATATSPAAATLAAVRPRAPAADSVDGSPVLLERRIRTPPVSLALVPAATPGVSPGSPAGSGAGASGGGLRAAAALVPAPPRAMVEPMKRRLKRLFTVSDSDQSHSDSEESGAEDR